MTTKTNTKTTLSFYKMLSKWFAKLWHTITYTFSHALSNCNQWINQVPLLRKYKVPLLALLTFLFLLWISKGLYHWISQRHSPVPTPVLAVQSVRSKTLTMPKTLETVGSLFSVNEAKLKVVIPGRVMRIQAASGSKVKKGTPLIDIVGGPEVVAPFDGFLTEWKVKVGEYVGTSAELVDLVDTELLTLQYRVPESYANQLAVGQMVHMEIRAFPEQPFEGKVSYISPVIDPKTHTILIHAEIKNPDAKLWPGMSAHVCHILRSDEGAIVIPEAAVILTLEGHEVFAVERGKLVRRIVQIGARHQGRVQILSGVKSNESVLLTHNNAIKEGDRVTEQPWTGQW